MRANMRGDTIPCTKEGILPIQKEIVLKELVYHGIGIQRQRLPVRPLEKAVELRGFNTPFCCQFALGDSVNEEGASCADFCPHVPVAPMDNDGVTARGLTCAELYGWPVAGALHLHPR